MLTLLSTFYLQSASAQIPDSLERDFQSFLTTLKSEDLTNREAYDSTYYHMPWDWKSVTDERFKEVIDLAWERVHKATSLGEEAVMYQFMQELYKAREMIGKSVVMYGKQIATLTVMGDTIGVMYAYHWMSWMFYHHKLYEECLISHRKAIEIIEPLEITEKFAEIKWTHGYFNSVAGWELKKPEYQDSAVKYLEEAFYHCKEVKNGEVHLEWVITYAMALARDGQHEEAIKIAYFGINQSKRKNEVLYLARFNKQLSQYYSSLEMEDSAYYHIYESAKYEVQLYGEDDPNLISFENGRGKLHVFNIGFLIGIHNAFDHPERSVAILDDILDGPNQIQDYHSLMYYRNLGAQSYHKAGDFKNAAHNYELYIKYQDSTHKANWDKSRMVKTAQLESQITIEKERAKQEQEQHQALAEQEKKNLRNIIYGVIIVVIVIVIFLIFLYRRFKVTSRQKKMIETQKGMVELAYKKLDAQNNEILDSINYAKRIQSAILPSQKRMDTYLPESFIVYLPKDIVAGDFYWLEHMNGDTIFAAADCTGHGVPGAMVSVICNNGLNRSVREYGLTKPSDILDKTRQLVIEEFSKSAEEVNDGMDVALCNLATQANENGNYRLTFAGANNPLWIIRKGATEVESYKGNRMPIGKYIHSKPYSTQELEVAKGDMIYVFTDGFADQFGGENLTAEDGRSGKGKKYYSARFQRFLLSIQHLSLAEQKQALIDEFNNWRGDLDQIDDICILGVRV